MREEPRAANDDWNPWKKIYEQIYHECIDQLWIVMNKSDHKKHMDWMHWESTCWQRVGMHGTSLMEGGPSYIPT